MEQTQEGSTTGGGPLAGRVVLVTGGAKRIGRAIALRLGAAGADVAITFRGSQAEAEETVRDIEFLQGNKKGHATCGRSRRNRARGILKAQKRIC